MLANPYFPLCSGGGQGRGQTGPTLTSAGSGGSSCRGERQGPFHSSAPPKPILLQSVGRSPAPAAGWGAGLQMGLLTSAGAAVALGLHGTAQLPLSPAAGSPAPAQPAGTRPPCHQFFGCKKRQGLQWEGTLDLMGAGLKGFRTCCSSRDQMIICHLSRVPLLSFCSFLVSVLVAKCFTREYDRPS